MLCLFIAHLMDLGCSLWAIMTTLLCTCMWFCVERLGHMAALDSALWGAFHLLFSLSLHNTLTRASSLCGDWGGGEPQSSAAAHAPCAIPALGCEGALWHGPQR